MEHADSPLKKNADPGQHTGPAQNVQAAPGGEADAATGTARHRGREEKHGSVSPVEAAPHDTASSVLDGWRHDKARGVGIAGHLAPPLAVPAKFAGADCLTLLREAAAAVFVLAHRSDLNALGLADDAQHFVFAVVVADGAQVLIANACKRRLAIRAQSSRRAELAGRLFAYPAAIFGIARIAVRQRVMPYRPMQHLDEMPEVLLMCDPRQITRLAVHVSPPHRLRGSEDQRQHDAGGNGALHDAQRDRCDAAHAAAFAGLRFGAGSGQYACQSSGRSSRTLMPVRRSSVAALFAGMPRDRQLHTVEADSPTAAPSFVGDPSK